MKKLVGPLSHHVLILLDSMAESGAESTQVVDYHGWDEQYGNTKKKNDIEIQKEVPDKQVKQCVF